MSEENWRDTLPDEIKGSEALATFEDVSALAAGYIEAKSYQGASVKIPGEDAGDEDKRAFTDKMIDKMPALMYKPDMENAEQSVDFYRSIGMPESADGYAIPEIKPPEGVEIKSDKAEAFKSIAHKHGLTAAQYKGIMGDITAADIVAAEDANKGIGDNMTAIKEKFGHAFSDNMNKINTLLSKTGAPEAMIEAVKSGTVGVNTINWLYQMGKQMGGEGFNFDDNDLPDDNPNRGTSMTPDEALAAIDEINRNKEHPYWVGKGDEKKRATDHMIKLMKFAHPEAA